MNSPVEQPIAVACGTKENPHQWTGTPRPADECLRCGERYDYCGIAWHEANVSDVDAPPRDE